MRNPRIEAASRARGALFAPFVLSSDGALGARANASLKQVFGFVKKEGLFVMRSSHPRRASTWPTTWFSIFWQQRTSTAAMATSAPFAGRDLRADQAAAFESPRSQKPHFRFPRHYYYNQNHGRQHKQYRSRSQRGGSDSGRSDDRRTSRNSGGCPFGLWGNSNGSMSSNHRPQRRVAQFSQVGGARS